MTTTIKYGNSTIATAENQTKTLLTANKYVGNNIEITDVSSGGGFTVDDIAMRTISGNISGSATNVSYYAFYNCQLLTAASFPNATSISGYAFQNCISLTTTDFPSVTTIYNSAFYNCSALTTISFPNVTTIRSYAFVNCFALTSASFPNATDIGNNAFSSCCNLLSFYLLGSSVPTLGISAFYSTPIGGYTTSTGGVYGSIFVPSSLYNQYIAANHWSEYSSRIVSV